MRYLFCLRNSYNASIAEAKYYTAALFQELRQTCHSGFALSHGDKTGLSLITGFDWKGRGRHVMKRRERESMVSRLARVEGVSVVSVVITECIGWAQTDKTDGSCMYICTLHGGRGASWTDCYWNDRHCAFSRRRPGRESRYYKRFRIDWRLYH
jgi:hypothetical protein